MIDDTNEQLGVISLDDALEKANALGVDLVEISPNANPPVCKIMNYGKFKYREQKKAHDMRAKQKQIQIKEIKLRPVTDDHDYQIKLRKAKEFFDDGDKVKFIIQFRGRELAHQEFGLRYLQRIEEDLINCAVVEQKTKVEGRSAIIVLSPKKTLIIKK